MKYKSLDSVSVIAAPMLPKKRTRTRTKKANITGSTGEVAYRTLYNALSGLSYPALYKAQDPFGNHPWVYAAAIAIAFNISQVPFTIYRETDDILKGRESYSRKHYGSWTGPSRGFRRTAVQRHLRKRSRLFGANFKGLEPDYTHEVSQLLTRVNPHMTDSQLWQLTAIELMTKGESFWKLTNEIGEPIGISEIPTYIWPMNPLCIKPIILQGQFVGWQYAQRNTDGSGGYSGKIENLQIWQVIQYKFINPESPLRGMSPLIPAASAIKLDLSSSDHTHATLVNGADPGGLLINKEGFDDPKEEQEFLAKYEQRHRGEKNVGRTGILSGGWDYFKTGMTPKDMDWSNLKMWDRDEILATMRTPKTIVGVTNELNYATQLGQDNNFWMKTLIPILKYFETVIDGTLLFEEPDNIVGAFDLSGVDALRAGLKEQVETANAMSGANLHVPPALSFEKVGLDIEDYEGSDTALISPVLSPVKDVIENAGMLFEQPTNTPEPEQPTNTPEPEVNLEGKSKILIKSKKSKLEVWKNYIATLHYPMMINASRQWRSFILIEKKLQLEKFDEVANEKSWAYGTRALNLFIAEDGYKPYMKAVRPEAVLLDLKSSSKRLGVKIRPVYDKALPGIYDYTITEMGGLSVFELDDPDIVSYFETAERTLTSTAPATIQRNVLKSMRVGIESGETISELRNRIAGIYNISASSAKTLQVARTESSSFINGARDVMFKKTGIEEEEWSTAGDELVRESHVMYGESGSHPIGFNYLTLSGKPGSLTYPGDKGAPADEIVNCRCNMIPSM